MLRAEDVEKLSRLLAGELDTAEAAVVERDLEARVELRQALERLRALDAATAELSNTSLVPDQRIEQAIGRALPGRRAPVKWLVGLAATLVALAGALLWRNLAVPVDPTHPASLASVRALPGSTVHIDETGAYVLSAGTAVFEGVADVRVEPPSGEPESFHVNGRALISTEPSVAIEHVTDLVTPTPEVTHMIQTAKTHWLTAALAVMVFQGQVLAAEGEITAGTHRSRPPDTQVKPSTAKAAVAVRGELAPEVVRSVFETSGGGFARCYETALSQNQRLEGSITVDFTIAPNGSVSESTIDQNYSLNNPFVSACVLQVVQGMKFPASKDGVSTKARFPVLFGVGAPVNSAAPSPSQDPAAKKGEAQLRAHIDPGASPMLGAKDAKVTVVLFSEASSPFGAAANLQVKPLEAEYAGRVRFVYKHALREEHATSRADALALQAAHNQGQFWNLLELIAQNPMAKNPGRFEAYARSLGLDVPRFSRDLGASTVAAAVDADLELAKRIGAQPAPTWFINGREFAGYHSLEEMRAAINAEL